MELVFPPVRGVNRFQGLRAGGLWGRDMLPKNLTCSPKEAAEFLCVKEVTLCNWRYLGKGPKYAKIGGKIRYFMADLKRYMAEATVEPPNRICG